MRKIVYGIILCVLTCGYANAAILVKSPNGTVTTKTNLAAAAVAADTVGKTIVVTSALSAAMSNISSATVHKWPADRKLIVEKGGSIGNTTKFEFEGGAQYEAEWFGTTTARLQKAFNSCKNSTMTISTNYILTSPVTISNANCTIKMLDGAKLISGFTPVTTQNALIWISGDNVTLQDWYVDGAGHGQSGVVTGGADNFKMLGGTVTNFVGTDAIGIAIGKSANGVATVASNNHMINGVKIVGNDYGIYVFSANAALVKNTTIQNCYVANSGNKGISFVADGGIIRNNFATGNRVAEMYVAGGGTVGKFGNVVIDSNRMVSTPGGARMGIKISTGTTNFQLTNNHIDTSASDFSASYFGIFLQGASNGLVANNIVNAGRNGAISVAPHPDPNGSNSYDIAIESNHFNSNGLVVAGCTQTASKRPSGSYTAGRIHWRKNTFAGDYSIGLNTGHDDSEYSDNVFIGNTANATSMMYLAASKMRILRNQFSGFTRSAILYEMQSKATADYLDTQIVGNQIVESRTPSAAFGRIQVVTAATNAHGITGMYIADNLIEGGSYGILVGTYNAAKDKTAHSTISGNSIRNTVRDGIMVAGDHFKITGNTILNFSHGTSSFNGIVLKGNFNTVENNTLKNTGTYSKHFVVFPKSSGNKIIKNFMDADAITNNGVGTENSGNIHP